MIGGATEHEVRHARLGLEECVIDEVASVLPKSPCPPLRKGGMNRPLLYERGGMNRPLLCEREGKNSSPPLIKGG